MAREIQPGRTISYTATGNIANGEIKELGSALFGVAPVAAVTGDLVDMQVEGVFSVGKIAAALTSFAQGAKVYAKATGGVLKVTGVATGNQLGTAWAAAATGDTTATVKLLGYGS